MALGLRQYRCNSNVREWRTFDVVRRLLVQLPVKLRHLRHPSAENHPNRKHLRRWHVMLLGSITGVIVCSTRATTSAEVVPSTEPRRAAVRQALLSMLFTSWAWPNSMMANKKKIRTGKTKAVSTKVVPWRGKFFVGRRVIMGSWPPAGNRNCRKANDYLIAAWVATATWISGEKVGCFVGTERKAISNELAEGFPSTKTLVHVWQAGAENLWETEEDAKGQHATSAHVEVGQQPSRSASSEWKFQLERYPKKPTTNWHG